MCEGISSIQNGPIPPHPMFLKEDLSNLASSRSNSSMCEGPSKISGPIASQFDDSKANKTVDYYVPPKIRGGGFKNFMADKKGTDMGMLIELQGRAIAPKTRGKFDNEHQKNYMASNHIKIKQLMRKVKEREENKKPETSINCTNKSLYGPVAVPVKVFHKSDKYKNVHSKLRESLQAEPLAPRETHTFLRSHSRTGSVSRPQSARQSPSTNDAKEFTLKKYASKDDFDFLKANQNFAKTALMKKSPSVENLKQVQQKMEKDLEKYQQKNKGKVPNYLEKRNDEIKQAKIEYYTNLPDPDCPPGHRKLPADEKEKTLNLLKESHKKMISELNSLPIRNDTFRLQSTKSDYEKKLTELDEAIKIFSKPKVFVKVE